MPYQAGKHLGVASCASSVCHGAVETWTKYDVSQNEYVTWSHEDRHSKAYLGALEQTRRAIAAKLGIADRAHASYVSIAIPTTCPPRGAAKFTISDGVSCEACHGGAESWLKATSRRRTYRQNVERGMYPTADPRRARSLCLSCHFGNEDKFVTHRIMAAGHPRLSFELDTFVALQPPHHQVDADYRKRKPAHDHAQIWAYGQLAACAASWRCCKVRGRPAPSFRSWRCSAAIRATAIPSASWTGRAVCSPSFPQPGLDSDRRLAPEDGVGGAQPDGSCRRAEPAVARAGAAGGGGAESREVASMSAQLMRVVGQALQDTQSRRWAREDYSRMLGELLRMGSGGEFRDYASAEQAVMAVELLMIDLGSADRHRKALDELYEILRDEDGYRPPRLVDAMKRLSASLRT